MKFEIINPSDKATIKGTYKECAVANALFGEGNYGLKQINGKKEMPLMILGGNKDWFKKTFNKTFEELLDELGLKRIIKCLKTVKTKTKSSLNDIEGQAQSLARVLKKMEMNKNDREN